MHQSLRLAVFAGLVFFSGLALYTPGLAGPLLFDDRAALSANKLVQIDGSSFDEWRVAALSSNSGPLRRPIAMASFAANHALVGDFAPVGLKAVNLAIHLLIASLIYFFSLAVLNALAIGRDHPTRQLIAITAAAIWLLHPLHVSTVLYAVQRMAQLATLFALSGLLIFMHYRQRWAAHGSSTGELIAAALWLVLMTALAGLSKENGLLLPWLIVVLEVGIFRGQWRGRSNRHLESAGWLLLVLPVLAVLLILAYSPDSLISGYGRREFTLEQRLFTQPRLLWRYLGWLFVPNIRDMGFQHDDIPLSGGLFEPLTTFLALVAWLLSLLLAFAFRRRFPLILLALLFYLVGHSMESSLIALEMVYEHRNYLPSIGVCLALAALIVVPASESKRVSRWIPVLGVLAVWAVLLFARVLTWSDELTLSRVNAANHPESSRSNYFYANALLRRFRQREQLDLSEQEAGDLLLISRHYFERMYQSNNRDVAALVMLFYLDSRFFPQLQQQIDWFDELDGLLSTRTLQPSDWNALATLMDCLTKGPCAPGEQEVIGLLDKLDERYPGSVQLLQYRYGYVSSLKENTPELLPGLEQARQSGPRSLWLYYALLSEYGRRGDIANMYETARLWLLDNRMRDKLPLFKAGFTVPETSSGSTHD